jgi:hypothetical protein
MPKALRSYYIAELALKAELETPSVLAQFTEYEVVSNEKKDVETSDTVEPAKE